MKQIEELQDEMLTKAKTDLVKYGIDINLLTVSNRGVLDLQDHQVDLSYFIEKTSFSRRDIQLRAYILDDGRFVFMPLEEFYDEYRSNDALSEEIERHQKEVQEILISLSKDFFSKIQKLNESKTLVERIIPGIASNIQNTDSLSTIKSWKAKVILANSAGPTSPKCGEFDKIGYIHIGLKHGNLIPIARADEHHQGFDLIEYLVEKGLIPEDTYYPLNVNINYVDANDAVALEAMKVWRKLGGPNVLIKHHSSHRGVFQITMDDYIKADANIQINKGSLLPLGAELLTHLKLLSSLCIESRKNERKEKQLYKQALKTYNFYLKNILTMEPKSAKLVKDKLDEAETVGGEEGIKLVEAVCFGFNSFKNELHNDVRKALDPKSYSFQKEGMEAIFGDLELANHELGAL